MASIERSKLTQGLPIVVVLGPTATGKTGFAIELALSTGAEVVNADSRYLYRGMDIGTAKPTALEMRGVPHHLVDICNPLEPYSLGQFLADALEAIERIAARGKPVIVVGGTPQYLRALIEGWNVPDVPPDEALRATLEVIPVADLAQQLLELDPVSAERIGPHNKRRIIRSLEIVLLSGKTMSESATAEPFPYAYHLVGLRQERDVLYPRIDARIREMFAAGWLDEIAALMVRGATSATPAMTAHGYREGMAVLNGDIDLEEAIRQTATMVHKYVRHQETWGRRFDGVHWVDSSQPVAVDAALRAAAEFLNRGSG